MLEKIGEQFFLWNVWKYVKNKPGKALTEVVCFLAIGVPFSWGLFRGEIVRTGAFDIVTVPSSSLGVFFHSGLATLGSTAAREDGTPVVYPEGTATVEKVGTGLTLADVEANQEGE